MSEKPGFFLRTSERSLLLWSYFESSVDSVTNHHSCSESCPFGSISEDNISRCVIKKYRNVTSYVNIKGVEMYLSSRTLEWVTLEIGNVED